MCYGRLLGYNDVVMNFMAETLDVVGTVLIGWAALRVHYRVLHEHKIDREVFRVMKFEQGLGVLGICLIIVGYLWRMLNGFV